MAYSEGFMIIPRRLSFVLCHSSLVTCHSYERFALQVAGPIPPILISSSRKWLVRMTSGK